MFYWYLNLIVKRIPKRFYTHRYMVVVSKWHDLVSGLESAEDEVEMTRNDRNI
jgi:hypothetical protein